MIEEAGGCVCFLTGLLFDLLRTGMCLISFPEWRQWVPEAEMLRMDRFYHAQEMRGALPAGELLQSGPVEGTEKKALEALTR